MMAVFLSLLRALKFQKCSLFLPHCSQQRAQKKASPTRPLPLSRRLTTRAERLYLASWIPVIHWTTYFSHSVRRGARPLVGMCAQSEKPLTEGETIIPA